MPTPPHDPRTTAALRSTLRTALVLPLIAALALPTAAVEPPESPPPDLVRDLTLRSEGEVTIDGRLELRFVDRKLSRTLIRWLLALTPGDASRNEHGYYNLRVAGELLRGDRPVDRFDYRFDVPADGPAEAPLALVFDRDLRPGDYELDLEVEDLAARRQFRTRGSLTVPALGAFERTEADAGRPPGGAPRPEPAGVRILPPESPVVAGLQRFAAVADAPGIAGVEFLLDDRRVMTKTRPPFEVELDLGDEVRVHVLEAVAVAADGAPLASDRLVLNTGQEELRVELLEPRRGAIAGSGARARVTTPGTAELAAVEYWLDDRRVAAVEDPPFDRRVELPAAEGTRVVRAVARLTDGRTAEDAVLVDPGALSEKMRVHLVELYTAVVDPAGRSVSGLDASSFRVREDGRAQELVRFARVEDMPCEVALVLDVSGSMEHELDAVAAAAAEFFRSTLRPGDRAAVVVFDRFPRMAVDYTSDARRLGSALVGLRAHGGTAIHQGLMYTLRSFAGGSGQRAVLLFSDGREQSGGPTTEEVLAYARRSGTTIYTVGLGIHGRDVEARRLLHRLAAGTGGRSFFLDDAGGAAEVYRSIAEEVRSRYLLAYQSSHEGLDAGFRRVEVEVAGAGLTARTIHGYFP